MSAPPPADPKGTIGFSSAIVVIAILAVLFAQSRSPEQQTASATPAANASGSGSSSPSEGTDELDAFEVDESATTPSVRVTTSTSEADADGVWVASLFAADAQHRANADEQRVQLTAATGVQTEILYSGDFTSLNCCYYVVHYDGGFSSGAEAAAWCRSVGRGTGDLCHGRFVSDEPGIDPADDSLVVYP